MSQTFQILVGNMIATYCFLVFLTKVASQEVEYYPSQAISNNYNYKSDVKREAILNVNPNSKSIIYRKFNEPNENKTEKRKRGTDPVFHGYPKTREELWNEHFLNESTAFDQTPSLIKLVHNITMTYLKECTPIILYDNQMKSKESFIIQNLFKGFPISFVHGYITDDGKLVEPELLNLAAECVHFIIFLTNVRTSVKVLGKQPENKVVIVARSSQWAVQEFLAGPLSRMFVNLLVIGQSFKEGDDVTVEFPYILYTHKLYTDGLGASQPVILNSWTHGKFSRNVNLFPQKMTEGYAGHRFVVAAANQPPFVFRRVKADLDGGNPRVVWDGVEIRLIELLAQKNNFSIEIVEPQEPNLGEKIEIGHHEVVSKMSSVSCCMLLRASCTEALPPASPASPFSMDFGDSVTTPGDAVSKEIAMGRASIGIAGMYMTSERATDMDMSFAHSQDCAVFITLMSTALPRYRAILGPFHWHVWVALTFTYLFAMFPLAFSDKHTLRHLLHNSGEIENMFWYVFGTFTNCFTFLGKNSWSKTNKITTRLLIGWYWIFTIIITSCYTGSIIAFVTLPVFPETVDTIQQLLAGFFRVGTLDCGGWERWFFNSSDPLTNKLLRKAEFVPNVEAGIHNTTKAFFWPYAFLGSQAELEYIVQANFSETKSKRAVLHISDECFVPFGVTIGFPRKSIYSAKLSGDILRLFQGGFVHKLFDEVRFEIQRSSTGKLLAAGSGTIKIPSAEEKGLTLADTQGMFLLLAAGFVIAGTALISEWMGGFSRRCRFRRKVKTPDSINSSDKLIPTPKSDISSEIKIIDEDKTDIDSRPSTTESIDTLNGTLINVTHENIDIHNNYNERLETRRSSSVEIDQEVREIFERDQMRRGIVDDSSMGTRKGSPSYDAFGDPIK